MVPLCLEERCARASAVLAELTAPASASAPISAMLTPGEFSLFDFRHGNLQVKITRGYKGWGNRRRLVYKTQGVTKVLPCEIAVAIAVGAEC